MEHTYERCTRAETGQCGGCSEDSPWDCRFECLSLCKVCGGCEGSLLPECPGRHLTFEEDQANYQHYCNGTGPFAEERRRQEDLIINGDPSKPLPQGIIDARKVSLRGSVQVLDHGYVIPITTWGSEEGIIEAARMSTSKGFQGWGPLPCPGPRCMPIELLGDVNSCERVPRCDNGWIPGDEKLLAYLYKNHHMTPFEMAGMTIEVQAPIFVFREWHRHRTQSYNELSARYTPLPDVNYVPTLERLMMGGGANKQAQGTGKELDPFYAASFREYLNENYRRAQELYKWALQQGIPKELARLVIPVGRYSRMRASANLRNWLQFLTLRMDSHAQWEIQQYADAVGTLVEQAFPRVWDLFKETK